MAFARDTTRNEGRRWELERKHTDSGSAVIFLHGRMVFLQKQQEKRKSGGNDI